MKIIVTIIFTIFMNAFLNAQHIDLNYYPPKTNATTAKDYNKGVRDLAYAYANIEENPNQLLNYIDYWRVAVAYIYMGVDKETVYSLLLKSKADNKKGFCIILHAQLEACGEPQKDSRFYKFLGKTYLENLSNCLGVDIETFR
ncbi:hypothetical protein [Aquimarina litoralis]|uniref:hypothetical protein n=1 Tax=Aquimarina litoralis TaxID=584605 RepID=UPI001C59B289|nr:hypothetical protein [Aquimarina litoralis]MBW1295395.1 hypothetical protein [Aquimarina litoralis]